MEVPTGVEPAIFCVTGRRDNHYTTEPWLRELDLNQRPLGYEPNELPLLHSAMSLRSFSIAGAKVGIGFETSKFSCKIFLFVGIREEFLNYFATFVAQTEQIELNRYGEYRITEDS